MSISSNLRLGLIIICTLLVAGCGKKSNLPADFPEIHKLTITVVQEGAPLASAMISLKPVGTADKYARGCSAVTDETGVASIKTYGQEGVPAGKYKILVSKMHDEEGTEIEDEFGGKSVVGAKVYSYIEKQYSDEKTTPFEIEVSKGGANSMTCDVGKATRFFVRNAS